PGHIVRRPRLPVNPGIIRSIIGYRNKDPPITPDQRPQPLHISMEIVHMLEYMPHGDGVEAILPEREKAVHIRELHLMVGARYLPCRFVRLQTGNLPA